MAARVLHLEARYLGAKANLVWSGMYVVVAAGS